MTEIQNIWADNGDYPYWTEEEGLFDLDPDSGEVKSEFSESLKEEADPKVTSYNKALAVAKESDSPVIYGYTNKTLDGKFFPLGEPIICDDVNKCTQEFKSQYKNCGQVYVAYPDKNFVESCKVSESLNTECLKESTDEVETFTPEEQEEYNCDEDGNCLDSYDRLHHCGWCGDIFTEYEMRHEADFGWICSRCEAELKSHGGPLMFIENESLNEDASETNVAYTYRHTDGEGKY